MDSVGSVECPRRQLRFGYSDGEMSPIQKDETNLIPLHDTNDLQHVHNKMDERIIPKMGLEFDNGHDVLQFYSVYAKAVGFLVRKRSSHSDKASPKKLIDMDLVCHAAGKRKEGTSERKTNRPETRTGCEAHMRVVRNKNGKLRVTTFKLEHNHGLASPDKVHMLRSRKISSTQVYEIETTNSVEIAQRDGHALMAKQAGGRDVLGFIPVDYRNYLRRKRQKEIQVGDTGGVLEYLQRMQYNDPNFHYAIQVDECDMLTNIFWTDAKMKADFVNFGDVICFDTTYGKDNEGRPIALFIGVNHHKQSIVLGSALLYDETTESFEWLFDTFSKAMSDAKPVTILTDQDAAMAKALASKWPETNHRLCIWHIYQNATIHLSHVFSVFKTFTYDFSRCIYDFEDEVEFLSVWKLMLEKYNLTDNAWLKQLFDIREKWALVYGRHMFCGDMMSTQRSESMNAMLKHYVSYKNKFLEFFDNFERMIETRRYAEMSEDLKAKITFPILKVDYDLTRHSASVYTPKVHALFEQEVNDSLKGSCEECEHDGAIRRYKVTVNKRFHHIVTHDKDNATFDCSCKKFQFAGILCSHVLKIFSMQGVERIPEKYILKRWTRKARKTNVQNNDNVVISNGLDEKVAAQLRYKDLCQLYIQLATKSSVTEDAYIEARKFLLDALEKVDEILQTVQKSDDKCSANKTSSVSNPSGMAVKGIKMKEKPRRGKRIKGGLETLVRKRTTNTQVQQLTIQDYPSTMHMSSGSERQCVQSVQAYQHILPRPLLRAPASQYVESMQAYQQALPLYSVQESHYAQNFQDYYGDYAVSQPSQTHGSNSNDIGISNVCPSHHGPNGARNASSTRDRNVPCEHISS